jgi:hypothetical protein
MLTPSAICVSLLRTMLTQTQQRNALAPGVFFDVSSFLYPQGKLGMT